MPKRRTFKRPVGTRLYRKLFIIAAEGTKTEPQYFKMFNNRESVVQVTCLRSRGSAPPNILKQMKKSLKNKSLKKSDEAWIVVDKDKWTEDQLQELYSWSQNKQNYGFALSNPKFEYWLLLHFEDGKRIRHAKHCSDRLKKHVPNYQKEIYQRKFTPESIKQAVKRAKKRDWPPCQDWPRKLGQTTVYRLVKKLIRSG